MERGHGASPKLEIEMNAFEQDLRNVKIQDLDDNLEMVDVSIEKAIIKRDDGQLIVSAESGLWVADYYGEFRGGFPWVHPAIEAVAAKHGKYVEWENAGAIGFAS